MQTNDTHSPRVFFSIISKLFFRSASSTRSAFSASIPDEIKRPPGLIKFAMQSESGMITSARMFATAMSTGSFNSFRTFSVSSSILRCLALMRVSSILLSAAFSIVASTAYGSMSRQNADFAPQSSEHIARIPLPQPMSKMRLSLQPH